MNHQTFHMLLKDYGGIQRPFLFLAGLVTYHFRWNQGFC